MRLMLSGSIALAALAAGMLALTADHPAMSAGAAPRYSGQRIPVHSGGIIVCEGDSLTYGLDRTLGAARGLAPINGSSEPRSTPFPETLARSLGGRVQVFNRGYPGDRVADGLRRWGAAPPADLVILMYGTNDADPARRNGVVPLEQFRREYAALIDRSRRGGAQVVVLLPPARRTGDGLLQTYRDAIRGIAVARGAMVIDTRDILPARASATTDGVHLNPAGYRAMGAYLAQVVSVH